MLKFKLACSEHSHANVHIESSSVLFLGLLVIIVSFLYYLLPYLASWRSIGTCLFYPCNNELFCLFHKHITVSASDIFTASIMNKRNKKPAAPFHTL